MNISLKQITLLPFELSSGPRLMAADQWMLEHPGTYLRFYQWSRPTLSLGRFQPVEKEMDLVFCQNNQIEVVRRVTGGQAVLHHQELTYSFASPTEDFPRSILHSYQQVRQPILAGLNQLGYRAISAGTGKFKPTSSVCFAASQGHEVQLDSRKLVGSAQRRKAGRLLQHGSILFDYDLDLCQGVWPHRHRSSWAKEMVGLGQQGGPTVNVPQLCQVLGQAFAQQFSTKITPKKWSESEQSWIKSREQGFLLS